MFEVEVKFRDDADAVRHFLAGRGCQMSVEKAQGDVIFVHKAVDGFNVPQGGNIIRIRTQNGKSILTVKQKGGAFATRETETVVENADATANILEMLDYKVVVTVNKKRITTKYENMEICFDNVEHLGKFVEVEIMVDAEKDKASALDKIKRFLKQFDITELDFCLERYDDMIYKKGQEWKK